MCGIFTAISTQGFHKSSRELVNLLRGRGPDHLAEVESLTQISHRSENIFLTLISSVLALRGDHVTPQPFQDSQTGAVLCWNGEAWALESEPIRGNDGQMVFDRLLSAVIAADTQSIATTNVLEVLRSITGPYAFVFFDKLHRQLFFGRDPLGRRSLLFHVKQPGLIELSSVAVKGSGAWSEVDADTVYSLPFDAPSILNPLWRTTEACPSSTHLTLFGRLLPVANDISGRSPLGFFNRELPSDIEAHHMHIASVNTLQDHLIESLKVRVLNVPAPPGSDAANDTRIAILFSGGLDCTVLAKLTHDILPPRQNIDLINVAFENPRSMKAASEALQKSQRPELHELGERATFEQKLTDSNIPTYESCPDRRTGRKAYEELRAVCPNRRWRFVAVNVPYKETIAHKSNVVELLYPHNTEMDLSIGYAFYFAARGIGIASESGCDGTTQYRTPARVFLSGLGADELFGGYTRHAIAYNRRGFTGLLDDLELDINRLGQRNLGRDDRIISHWSREARFPYLDESLIKWALSSPVWEKCGYGSINAEIGESTDIESGKKVLRLLASNLGLHSVAREKKRAIQFGARTAKMETGKTKGTSLIS